MNTNHQNETDNLGHTVIWRLGPPIPQRGVNKDHRRRMSERLHVMYWRPDASDEAAAVTWKELTDEQADT